MNGGYKTVPFLLALTVLAASLETGQSFVSERATPPPLPEGCTAGDWGPWGACFASRSASYCTYTRFRNLTDTSTCPPCSDQDTQPCYTVGCPADCQVGEFGDWSVCDPCLNTQSRYSSLVRPSQYGGSPCTQPLVETRGCSSDKTCPLTSGCTSGQFKCVTTGRCVPASFRCNGDDDCGDESDEQECSEVQDLCEGIDVEDVIPNIDFAGSGYNVLTGELSGQVLDNSKYGGLCRTVYSGDHGKTFRLPHNTQLYRFQVVADTTFHSEQFNSSKQFYQETTSNRQLDIHAGVSASFAVFKASAEVTSSQSQGNHDVIKSSQSSDSALFTVSNQIELAQFRMNSENLILTDSFYRALEELPVVYSYVEYRKLIVDFGTHYLSAGSLGGQYRYVYRYNRQSLTESALSEEDQKSCLSVEAKVSFLGIKIGGDAGFKHCQDNKLSQTTAGSFTLAASDSVSFVKGGTSEAAGSLAYANQPMTDKYDAWVDSVKDNPAVISAELHPLSELVAGVSLAALKKVHLEQALVQYLNEFHPCKCAPCRNNGKAVLIGTTCECVCQNGTYGASCENVADPSEAVEDVDGSWSCWTGWSACSARCGGGSSGRKRACDNPVNSGGGQFCMGDNLDSKTCNIFPCDGLGTTLFPEAIPTTTAVPEAVLTPAPRTGGKLPPGQVATVSALAVVACLAVVGPVLAYRFGRRRRHGPYGSLSETTPILNT